MNLLKNKNIILTGASRGIGKGIAEVFVKNGANLAFTHISPEENVRKLEQELEKFGTKVKAFKSDASSFDAAHKLADDVLKELNINDPVLEIAKRLEEVALEDDYFKSRNLYPNVDFYSGIIYRALGIPTDMFTVMFALGRLPGWIAQWKEMRENHEPIGRPRQVYTGSVERKYVPIKNR